MAKILVFGLEHPLADELIIVLQQLGQNVQIAAIGSGALDTGDVNLIFADSGDLGAIRRTRPELPVVVVSRLPEVSAWLDALEQGAADYCGAPFERKQVSWILNSSLTRRGAPRHSITSPIPDCRQTQNAIACPNSHAILYNEIFQSERILTLIEEHSWLRSVSAFSRAAAMFRD